MRDLLRRFPAVPLALAAYNAGPAPSPPAAACPPYAETPGYVARDPRPDGRRGASGGTALTVRLVD